MNENKPVSAFEQSCSQLRMKIKEIGNELLKVKKTTGASTFSIESDVGEMMANLTIAYRHLEDAAMRLGKGIQAFEGGKSIYDSNDAKRVAGN